MGSEYKHRRKSTASDEDQPVSPGKARGSKRRKTTHIEDDGIASSYAQKLLEAENALKSDLAAWEAHMAREEAAYAAAMERIVNARREASIWRENRISQWDTTRRELMAGQQDAELAAELARMRFRKAREKEEAMTKDREGRRKERRKKRAAELRRAEADRAARQQPEVIVEGDLCYISDLDDEFMDAEDEHTPSSSDMGDDDSLDGASVGTHIDDDTEDEMDVNITARPGKIEVEQGDESDEDLEVEGLSNHSDYMTDDDSHITEPTSSTRQREAAQAEARARIEREARARAEVEQANAERERARREREWRAQQETLRREQQERFRREQQERVRREQQERARREYEQQQRRAAEDSRRGHSRRPMESPSSIAAAWARYTVQWAKLQGTGAPGKKTTDAILYFSNIPWPTVRAPRGPDDITKEAVAALVLSPSHSPDKNAKARLRELLLLWHPDKFVGRWMSFVVPADQEDVTEGVMTVARIANELLAERNL